MRNVFGGYPCCVEEPEEWGNPVDDMSVEGEEPLGQIEQDEQMLDVPAPAIAGGIPEVAVRSDYQTGFSGLCIFANS